MESNGSGTATSTGGAGDTGEARGDRLRRHSQRVRLYGVAFALVALLVCLVALVVANTRSVKLSWVFGDTNASLVWIILASAILGWLLGLATSIAFRRRLRRDS
jgi:uncharacterized integral membrane protein